MDDKLQALLQNQEAVKKINSSKSETEIVAIFRENGFDVSSIEDLKKLAQNYSKELSDEELDDVAGAGACLGIGIGVMDANICFGDGVSAQDDDTGGFGGTACFAIGVGAGVTYCWSNSI